MSGDGDASGLRPVIEAMFVPFAACREQFEDEKKIEHGFLAHLESDLPKRFH